MKNNFFDQPWLVSKSVFESILNADIIPEGDIEALAAKVSPRLERTWTVQNRDGIAIVPVKGVITRYDSWRNWYYGGTSVEDLATDFDAALENDEIKAIILDMDSPGGDARGIHEFSEMVKKANKPVYAYVGATSASGAYWIAAATKKIVVDPTAELGSIGVVFGFRKQGDNIIKIISTVSPKKQLDPGSKKGREEIQTRADDLAEIFVSKVAKYRKVSVETVINDFGQGGMFIAQKAIEAGMADRIGNLEGLIKELQEKTKTPNTLYGGYMGLRTDLRAMVAGKDDNEIEAAFASLGYVPETTSKNTDTDLDTVKAEAMEEGKQLGKKEGMETGKTDALDNVKSILDNCELANVSSPKFIKGLLDSTPEEAGKEIQNAKADGSLSKTIFSTINPMSTGEKDLLVADAEKRAEEAGN